MAYLVCGLDDEHYTMPDFYVCSTLEKAKEISHEMCKEFVDYYSDYYPEYHESEMRLDVTAFEGGYYDGERFYVTEILEVTGDYALVEHHAYDGVDFEVKCCGTYEECEEKRKEWIEECGEDYTEEEPDTYDTGTEWIHISLIELKENV